MHSAVNRTCNRLNAAGYWALTALALTAPFEVTQHPLLETGFTTFTTLTALVYVVAALAVATLAPHCIAFARAAAAGEPEPANYFYRRRLAIVLFVALLASCVVSSLVSTDPGGGLKWTLDILLGGLIWLAVPLWLLESGDRRIGRLCQAIVLGAVIAALVGIGEVLFGAPFDRHLLWFKAAPTTEGPFLRLSGTFDYANTAAMYFELALPFAVVGLLRTIATRNRLPRDRRRLVAGAAWLVAVDVLFAALLLTYSRGALLGLAVGTVVALLAPPTKWLVAHTRGERWWLVGIAANLAAVAGAAVLVSPSLVVLRWTTNSDQAWYRAAYYSRPPATMSAGARIKLPVTVANDGPLTWSAAGSHPYQLGYHWLYPSGKVAIFGGVGSGLSANVPPGHSETVVAQLSAPKVRGRYLLVWDMVQQGVTWFSLKSGAYASQPVRVIGSATAPAIGRIRAGGPATLQTATPPPSRGQLWTAAFRMIAAHPLLGIGPNGYRLNYGTYLVPKKQTWDKRILANSLPLEIFADLGLIGGALFFALFAAMAWPLIMGLWNGQVVVWWQLALIGSLAAFLGHGLVDYILISNAIFFLFWILCGLATTASERNVTVTAELAYRAGLIEPSVATATAGAAPDSRPQRT